MCFLSTSRSALAPLALLLVLLAGGGCGYSSYMTTLEVPEPITTDAEHATVVFVRPSGGLRSYPVMDHVGRFVAELEPESYVAVQLPPGDYTFIAWSEATPALKASIDAGRVYYVWMDVIPGAWSPHARLFAVGRGRNSWRSLRSWLERCDRIEPLPGAAEQFAYERARQEIDEVVAKGLRNFREYDDEERRNRTLVFRDGVPEPVSWR